ncbi:MAG: hypothetical protein P4L98_10165 [Ancalomicrobiaceae bacterium]|nr:hypothetical protein [Ancalomicrobiaceae bacterium]
MAGERHAIERVGERDRHADFCLWDYQPPRPAAGKLASSNLLWRAIEASAEGDRLVEACETLRGALGPGMTVYGVKSFGGRLAFEFYFYDYARLERSVSISRVLDSLAPLTTHDLKRMEGRPYFMFSIDLDEDIAARRKPLEVVNMYIGNPGSAVSSGICYEVGAHGPTLSNFYFFFDAKTEMNEVYAKAACSAHHDLRQAPLAAVFRKPWLDCQVTVVANKRANDGVYFSRVGIDALIDFLKTQAFPAALTDFARDNRAELDHLLWDLGVDYVVEAGEARLVKSAFYGLL